MKAGTNTFRRLLVLAVVLNIATIPGIRVPQIVQAAPMTPSGICAGFSDVGAHYYMCEALQYESTNPAYVLGGPAISGYSDTAHCGGYPFPCFAPQQGITRGQICKTLALTFGWSYGGNSQDFTDVPLGSTFYKYIEAVYHHPDPWGNPSIVGYNDSGHCGSAIPCFLPNNGVTRGQISKMTSNARGYTDDTGPRQATYADVAKGSAFFDYIERLTMHVNTAPYPPDMSQPVCTATNPQKPCYYPNTFAPRADAIQHVYSAYRGPDSAGQVFPHKYGDPTSAGWDAIVAYVQVPNPGPSASNRWVATPIAISSLYGDHFAESGVQKFCSSLTSCAIHPYASWNDGTPNQTQGNWDTTVNLTPGAGYTFRTDPDGTNKWKPQWCDSAHCQSILYAVDTGELGIGSLPFFVAGGESSNLDQHWGTIYIYNVSAHNKGGNWTSSCYDPVIVSWETGYGTVGPCTNVSDWAVNY